MMSRKSSSEVAPTNDDFLQAVVRGLLFWESLEHGHHLVADRFVNVRGNHGGPRAARSHPEAVSLGGGDLEEFCHCQDADAAEAAAPPFQSC